jgi:hypothetical protein
LHRPSNILNIFTAAFCLIVVCPCAASASATHHCLPPPLHSCQPPRRCREVRCQHRKLPVLDLDDNGRWRCQLVISTTHSADGEEDVEGQQRQRE